jgi:hypothetical protein
MNQSWLQSTKDRLQDERDAINAMDITPKVPISPSARSGPLGGATNQSVSFDERLSRARCHALPCRVGIGTATYWTLNLLYGRHRI